MSKHMMATSAAACSASLLLLALHKYIYMDYNVTVAKIVAKQIIYSPKTA